MEEKDILQNIELLIDKKIAESNQKITESRLQHLITIAGILLAVFAIILPLFFTLYNESKVDQAIANMKNDFNEFAGKQLRKPKILCYVDGNRLDNGIIHFEAPNYQKRIIIKNEGDGTADFLKIKLYIDSIDDYIKDSVVNGFEIIGESDKVPYKRMFRYQLPIGILPAKDSISLLDFGPGFLDNIEKPLRINALLLVYYGEPNPAEIPFIYEFIPSKTK